MKCPFCGCSQGVVLDSRDTPDGEAVRRRRRCEKCGQRFTTYERAEELEIRVIKKSGKKESYDREKLRRGIVKATWKRPVSRESIEQLLDEVEKKLRARGKNEVTSAQIGNLAIAGLKDLDNLSYLLFACVYRDFSSLEDFKREIDRLS
ncbi:MAG: transcriptional regulator NrdR [bacterium]|nr:transcriptional regulator NrdR [bacterium]